ncbi:MAG: PAS domain-containing protein, partial [Gemmataceae bacterium]|nr:PAS domain-containing protein [Gemmataceae bacterium]
MLAHDPADLAQALFEEIGDALFLIDPETDRLVDANPTAVRLTGFGRAELLGFPATHLFRADGGDRDGVRGAVAKTAVFHAQDGYLLRAKVGGWVPVGLTVSRLHVAPRTLGLITARDDRARRAALARARGMEAELRAVLAASPAALWSAERAPGAGPDGWQFRYVAPHLAALAGRPAGFPDHPL